MKPINNFPPLYPTTTSVVDQRSSTPTNISEIDTVNQLQPPTIKLNSDGTYCLQIEDDTYDISISEHKSEGIFTYSHATNSYFLKPGAKRLHGHNAVYKLATNLGLSDCIAPVSKVNVENSSQLEHSWTLYNGNVVFSDPNNYCTVFSQQQLQEEVPFDDLPPLQKNKIFMICLALGINDVKTEDIVQQIVDVEEALVAHPQGKPFSHLPLLKCDCFHQNLEIESSAFFTEMVHSLDIDEIILIAQKFKVEDADEDDLTLDKCDIELHSDQEKHPPRTRGDSLFCEKKCAALKERLVRIKNFIQNRENHPYSLKDLALYLDPAFESVFEQRMNPNLKDLVNNLEGKGKNFEAEGIDRLISQKHNLFSTLGKNDEQFLKLIEEGKRIIYKRK